MINIPLARYSDDTLVDDETPTSNHIDGYVLHVSKGKSYED